MKTLQFFLAVAIATTVPLLAQEAKTIPPTAAVAPAAKDVTPDEAQKLLAADKEIVVLDVRTPEEFAAGHIAGAKNVDVFGDDFAKQVAAIDPSKRVLVHCAAGKRSTQALSKMKGQPFREVLHMNGGFKAWEQAGKPIEK